MTEAPLSHATNAPRFLDVNLSRLPPETERALRADQPGVSLQATDSGLKVRTPDRRWVPLHQSAEPVAASERAAERFADQRPPLIIVIGLGLGYFLDALERRGSTTRVLA